MSPCHIGTLSRNAYVEIGENTAMTGVRIYSAVSVVIGKRCLIGTGTMILDTDGHELDPDVRKVNPSSRGTLLPVIIGDDVLVGAHSIILKGANIGSGSVVGAGSVVTGKFPERSIIAGNPARLIRTME